MGSVIVANHVTLDGVMQSPARPDEDPRDGFVHGGWAVPRSDPLIAAKIGERIGADHAFLFGRRTYEDFYEVWPKRTGERFSESLTQTPKYVASRTLTEPLPWANSILLGGDALDAVAELKQRRSGNLVIFGSGELISALLPAGLIDECLLMIHPLVLGSGRRLFPPGVRVTLRLAGCDTTATGVLIALFEPLAGPLA
jgi:dihydrofolate reductase